EPEFWIKSLPEEHLSDNSTHQFVEHLVRARHALDHGESATTSSELEDAAAAIDHEVGRAFILQTERLEAKLSRKELRPCELAELIADAAHLATLADQAGARITLAEVRVLLARALLADHRVEACLETLDAALDETFAGVDLRRVRASASMVRGEALLVVGTR